LALSIHFEKPPALYCLKLFLLALQFREQGGQPTRTGKSVYIRLLQTRFVGPFFEVRVQQKTSQEK
jgi:hypothetical protein